MTVEEIHEELFHTLLHIDEICREHHITYFLGFGSLLGCMRDHGYIAWDDDIDIWMKREDWEKFNQILPDCIDSKRYFYINQKSRKEYPYWSYITRIGPKGTFRKMDYFLDDDCYQSGIFIDVFVLEHAPENLFFYRVQSLLLGICDTVIFFQSQKEETVTEWITIGKWIYRLIGKSVSTYRLNQARTAIQIGWRKSASRKLCVPMGDLGRYTPMKAYYDASDFDKAEYKEFVVHGKDANVYKHDFPVPSGWEHVLEITYNAWKIHPIGKQPKGVSYWDD